MSDITSRPNTTENQLSQKSAAAERRCLDAGCYILYERVAEAYDPEWRDLLSRIYVAMRDADLTKDAKEPWNEPND